MNLTATKLIFYISPWVEKWIFWGNEETHIIFYKLALINKTSKQKNVNEKLQDNVLTI